MPTPTPTPKSKSKLTSKSIQSGEAPPSFTPLETEDHLSNPRNPLSIIFNYIWSASVFTIACYSLWELNFLKILLHSPKINHTLFLLSLSSSILILTIKIYLEAIAIPILKQVISYETIPQLTHLALILILISSFTFIFSISPQIGIIKAFGISCIVGYGIVWQYFLNVPYSNLQNVIALVGCVYFLQLYTGFVDY